MYNSSEDSDSDEVLKSITGRPFPRDKGVSKFLEKNKRKDDKRRGDKKKKYDSISKKEDLKMDKGYSQIQQYLQSALQSLNKGMQNPQMLQMATQEAITHINTALTSMRMYEKGGCVGCGSVGGQMYTPPVMGGQMYTPPVMGGQMYTPPVMGGQMPSGQGFYAQPSGFAPASEVISNAMRK